MDISDFNLQKKGCVILFYSLALTSVKYALSGIHIGNYIKLSLTPHIQECLQKKNPEKDFSHIFHWEKTKGIVRRYGFLLLPANGAHYLLPLFAAILCVLAFFILSPGLEINPAADFLVFFLLLINSVALLYTIIVGLYAGYSR